MATPVGDEQVVPNDGLQTMLVALREKTRTADCRKGEGPALCLLEMHPGEFPGFVGTLAWISASIAEFKTLCPWGVLTRGQTTARRLFESVSAYGASWPILGSAGVILMKSSAPRT